MALYFAFNYVTVTPYSSQVRINRHNLELLASDRLGQRRLGKVASLRFGIMQSLTSQTALVI